MLTTNNFTRSEAVAIMAIVAGTSAADMRVLPQELNFINNLMHLFNIDEYEKQRFKTMHANVAAPIISAMSIEKKRLVACLLTVGVAADGQINTMEEQYIRFVSSQCNLPIETSVDNAFQVAEQFFAASM